MTREQWMPVAGYAPRYEISNMGRVKSREYVDTFGRIRKEKFLKSHPNWSGHHQVILYRTDGKREYPYIHRLVLEAFVGPAPKDKPYGLHKDDDKGNNTLSNLYWGSPSENRYDAVVNGRDYNARKTHCKWGHEFTEENTRKSRRNTRVCISCERLHARGTHPRNKK